MAQIKYIFVHFKQRSVPARAFDTLIIHNSLVNLFRNEELKETVGGAPDKKYEKNVEVSCDTLFLFVDEADLTYHPEWQRQFVSLLTAILPRMFCEKYESGKEDGCKDIQVIMATHSPLLLSDIPVQSCIFLEKTEGAQTDNSDRDEQKQDQHSHVVVLPNGQMPQTFGANIHDLLNDAFFLKRTIGEFAHKKIIDIFKDLKELEQNPRDIEKKQKSEQYIGVIELIGDPVIRNKLLQLYYRCFPNAKIDKVISDICQISEKEKNLTTEQREKMIEELEAAVKRLRH